MFFEKWEIKWHLNEDEAGTDVAEREEKERYTWGKRSFFFSLLQVGGAVNGKERICSLCLQRNTMEINEGFILMIANWAACFNHRDVIGVSCILRLLGEL